MIRAIAAVNGNKVHAISMLYDLASGYSMPTKTECGLQLEQLHWMPAGADRRGGGLSDVTCHNCLLRVGERYKLGPYGV
jgi:hypothetical protein